MLALVCLRSRGRVRGADDVPPVVLVFFVGVVVLVAAPRRDLDARGVFFVGVGVVCRARRVVDGDSRHGAGLRLGIPYSSLFYQRKAESGVLRSRWM